MKKIFSAVCVWILTGCAGFDDKACFLSAKREFPKCEITVIKGKDYSVLVRDTLGNVMYVSMMNLTNTDVTSVDTMFSAMPRRCP
jgi:hypothetical protein